MPHVDSAYVLAQLKRAEQCRADSRTPARVVRGCVPAGEKDLESGVASRTPRHIKVATPLRAVIDPTEDVQPALQIATATCDERAFEALDECGIGAERLRDRNGAD